MISDFTLVGETDVDEATGKATTAEAMIVTVIGHPTMGGAEHKEHAAEAAKGEGKEHAQHHHHRMNLYVVAMTPKTKVCEVMASGKEVAVDDKDADFDDLEIGDRVELTFSPKMMEKQDSGKQAAGDSKSGDKKSAMARHGRHRTFFGAATEVKLMAEPMDGEHQGSKESKDAKGSKDSK